MLIIGVGFRYAPPNLRSSNILPQVIVNGTDPWGKLEDYLRGLVQNKNQPKEFYITAGRVGEIDRLSSEDGSFQVSVPQAVWKVVLQLDPGQGLSDVDQNTIAFAVLLDNDTSVADQDWQDSVIPINYLEELLEGAGEAYNFLSEIPDKIEKWIESNPNYDQPYLGSPLLAASGEMVPIVRGPNFNVATGHGGLPEKRPFKAGSSRSFSEVGMIQPSSFQVGIGEISSDENAATQVSIYQISPDQLGITHYAISQCRSCEISLPQNDTRQLRVSQVNPSQIGTSKVCSAQAGTVKVSTTQINTWQVSPFQIDPRFETGIQINTSEIPFATGVSSEQFFNIHHSWRESLSELKHSASELWNSQLDSQTPFDLTLQITDLPAGQLAEAQITDFNPSGQPIAGILLIDHNASGVGWFIDPTPRDHVERDWFW